MRKGGEGERHGAGQRKTVLIVDDSPHIRGLVSLVMEKHGYAVVGAEDGLDALFLQIGRAHV